MTYDALVVFDESLTRHKLLTRGRRLLAPRCRAFGEVRLENLAGTVGLLRFLHGQPPRYLGAAGMAAMAAMDSLELDQDRR